MCCHKGFRCAFYDDAQPGVEGVRLEKDNTRQQQGFPHRPEKMLECHDAGHDDDSCSSASGYSRARSYASELRPCTVSESSAKLLLQLEALC